MGVRYSGFVRSVGRVVPVHNKSMSPDKHYCLFATICDGILRVVVNQTKEFFFTDCHGH